MEIGGVASVRQLRAWRGALARRSGFQLRAGVFYSEDNGGHWEHGPPEFRHRTSCRFAMTGRRRGSSPDPLRRMSLHQRWPDLEPTAAVAGVPSARSAWPADACSASLPSAASLPSPSRRRRLCGPLPQAVRSKRMDGQEAGLSRPTPLKPRKLPDWLPLAVPWRDRVGILPSRLRPNGMGLVCLLNPLPRKKLHANGFVTPCLLKLKLNNWHFVCRKSV